MDLITFDTCIYITYQPPSRPPRGFRMTAVVLEELTAGSADDSEVRRWNQVRRFREADGTLFTPNAEDWWQAGKILNSLRRGLKSKKTGKIPKHSASHTERIIRDTLIARVCKREKLTLVTDNLKDFKVIEPYCQIKIISGKDYFGS